jgi:hypothetical protein
MSAYMLNNETKTLATLLAQNSFAKYQHVRGHYRNSYSSHFVGKIGELTAFIWLREAGLNPVLNVIDPKADKLCDIDTDVGRIEVKTWNEKYWDDLGRAITVSQLSSIQKKADVVLWCVANDVEADEPMVAIKGWNAVSEIDMKEPLMTGALGRQVYNYQIAIDDVHDINKLKQGKI